MMESTDFLIRPETVADRDAIAEVHRLAFGQDAEGQLVAALRAGGFLRVSLVAEAAGRVVGHVLFGDLAIESAGGRVAALALAPLAVAPDHQRRGIGSALVREGLRLCVGRGDRIVIVVGDPAFYGRFGFSAPPAERLESPYAGPAFQALELVPGALDGVAGAVVYPPPFAAF
jgi:putative acetyltransferase